MAGSWNVYGFTPNGKDGEPVYRLDIEDDIYGCASISLTPAELGEFIKACQLVESNWTRDIEGNATGLRLS